MNSRHQQRLEAEVTVIGGGLLGAAIAYGLARTGRSVIVFDEHDAAIRTARGNFGLVWVQGKGDTMAQYARWTLRSAHAWPAFANELEELTGTSVSYSQPGGFVPALDDASLEDSRVSLQGLRDALGNYDFEMLSAAELRERLPRVGREVVGASWCPHDGHCNPLRLLRALHESMQQMGVRYVPNARVAQVAERSSGDYEVSAAGHLAVSAKVVLAAGHGSVALGETLGMQIPVFPEQGQVIVTEKAQPLLQHPTHCVRQTDDGTFLLGASARDTGFDTATDRDTLRSIAGHCGRVFPFLKRLRVQRAWGALRIMTPDGYPVYQRSSRHPGVFSFACHSGVTLAAVHAGEVAKWIVAGDIPAEAECFGVARFDV